MLWNGNECGKNESNENFKTTIPSKNYDSPKQLENVESFKYLCSITSNNARCTWKIKSSIAVAKAVFKNKICFQQQIGRNFLRETSKPLHLQQVICMVLNIAHCRKQITNKRRVLNCGDRDGR